MAAAAAPDRAARAVLVRAGALAGLISGLVGVGGGVVMVPAMVSPRVGLSQRRATGTSLLAILPIATVAAVTYVVAGNRAVDGVAVVLVVPGSIAGAAVGARLTAWLPDRALALAFSALTLAAAVRLLIPAGLQGGGAAHWTVSDVSSLLGIGVAAGLASGLLGIGGGVIVTPALVLGLGVSQQVAQGTALAGIVPTGLSGTLVHARLGNVDVRAARRLAGTGTLAAMAGAALATHLPQTPLRVLFAAYIGVVGCRVGARALRRPTLGGPRPDSIP